MVTRPEPGPARRWARTGRPGEPRPSRASLQLRWALLAALLLGCGSSSYLAPTSDEPHADFLFERDYDVTAGSTLLETLSLLGEVAFTATSDVNDLGDPRIDKMLVHPEPTLVTASTRFVHYEYQLVPQSYYSGSIAQSAWVYRLVTVVDGGCSDSLWISPQEGKSYVLQMGTEPGKQCQLVCFEQPEDNMVADRKPCPLPTVDEKNALEPFP